MSVRVAFTLVLLVAVGISRADERILQFHSDIVIHSDGRVSVTETITVRSHADRIQRGIYRDIQTEHTGRWGSRQSIPFRTLQALRDGQPEPYHEERTRKMVRVRIGREDVLLAPGEYTYTLVYELERQIAFFPDRDELYWNVTGNEWEFAIEQASVSVTLPEAFPVREISATAYTGPKGSREQHCRASVPVAGRATFETTRPLGAGEGLTIVVGFPKGAVVAPGAGERFSQLFVDNRSAVVALVGALLVLVYYVSIWWVVGRDPQPGAIALRTEPPDGLSPAACRFVRRMGFDRQVLVAALVNMAVKGYLRIVGEKGQFTLVRAEADARVLSPEERAAARKLFGKRTEVVLKQSNQRRIAAALSACRQALVLAFETRYFHTNRKYLVPGIALGGLSAVGSILLLGWESALPALFMIVWLSFWTVGVFALLREVFARWSAVRISPGGAEIGQAVFLSFFSVPFVAGECFGAMMLLSVAPLWLVCLIGTMIGLNILFYQLLKAPTLLGRQVMDHVEGFARYLEGRSWAAFKTGDPYGRLLPYAIALDCANSWSEALIPGESDTAAIPPWYSGGEGSSPTRSFLIRGLGTALGSAVATSSSASASPSGGGSSGSSGGGRGGSGGGGW